MRREMRTLSLMVCVVGFAVGTLPKLWGQTGGGTISGYVLDASNAVVPNAQVIATNLGTGVNISTMTNDEGYYEFPLLPAGQYVVEGSRAGFGKGRSAPFTLSTGTHPRVDLTLPVASTVSQVQVTATAPIINAETTDLGNVINTTQVSELPLNGRSWLSLVNLQPGAQNAPSNTTGARGGMWFNGSPAYGNQLLVDGVDMSFIELTSPPTDQSAGAGTSLMGGISLGAVSEVKVDSSSLPAEYGNSVGGVVNLTTKSGTNQFHGDAFEFVRNDILNANNFFANSSGTAKPPLRWNQFGADFGGPILKDKLFFFLNYEGVREESYTQESGYVPTALMLSQITTPALVTNLQQFPAATSATTNSLLGYNIHFANVPDTENDSLARVDYNFGKQRLAVRYSNNWSNYISPTITPDDVQLAPFHYNNLVAEYTTPLNPHTLNEFRFGYARINLDRKDSTLNDYGGIVYINSPSTSTGFQSEIHYMDTSYTIMDNFTDIRGAHTFKAGFQIMDMDSRRFQDTGLETYFQTPTAAIDNDVLQLLINFPANKKLQDWTYSFFGQDEWRISRTLQVNAGLRWEHFTPLEGMWNTNTTDPFGGYISALGDPMFVSHWRDLDPRLGVVWSPSGSQKLVIRAGGGISYMAPQPFFLYDFAAISPLLPEGMTITQADVPTGYSLAFPFPKLQFVSEAEANPNIVSQLGIIAGRNVADYNSKDYETGQWNLSAQSALTNNLSLQVAYVGNHAWHMYFNLDPNMFMPGQTTRPLPSYGNVQYVCPCGSSSYDALQISLNEHGFHGLVLDAYYTYADNESFGMVNDVNNVSSNNLQNPYNIANSYGPVDGSMRQMFVLDHAYLLPTPGFAKSSGYGREILRGWSLEGIMGIMSGIPVNVLAGKDLVRNTRITGDRPDIVPGVNRYIRSTTGALQWLNPAAFDVNDPYNAMRFGDLSYNALTSPGSFTYDAGLHKTFNFREKANLTFRAEAFNLFNHPVLGGLDATVTDPKFGQLTSASAARAFQLALILKF